MRQLDGLPLAIELAASRARMLPPGKILARLQRRFDLLCDRSASQTSRHAALRETIAWSWELLSDIERATLAQLAVFEGGFELEAAEAVVSLAHFEQPPWIVEVLESLLDRSLLRPVRRGERFELLVSIRAFALEQLEAPSGTWAPDLEPSSWRAELERRHLAHFASLGIQIGQAWRGTRDDLELPPSLHRDRENFSRARETARRESDWSRGVLVQVALAHLANEGVGDVPATIEQIEELLELPALEEFEIFSLLASEAELCLQAG